MLTDEQKCVLIEVIKQLANPSGLEKDILDTIKELSKQSFDMSLTQERINLTYGKYPDIYAKVCALPTTIQKRRDQMNVTDFHYILQVQLDFLLEKEWEAKHYG